MNADLHSTIQQLLQEQQQHLRCVSTREGIEVSGLMVHVAEFREKLRSLAWNCKPRDSPAPQGVRSYGSGGFLFFSFWRGRGGGGGGGGGRGRGGGEGEGGGRGGEEGGEGGGMGGEGGRGRGGGGGRGGGEAMSCLKIGYWHSSLT